jgi:hypothetical protein
LVYLEKEISNEFKGILVKRLRNLDDIFVENLSKFDDYY